MSADINGFAISVVIPERRSLIRDRIELKAAAYCNPGSHLTR